MYQSVVGTCMPNSYKFRINKRAQKLLILIPEYNFETDESIGIFNKIWLWHLII